MPNFYNLFALFGKQNCIYTDHSDDSGLIGSIQQRNRIFAIETLQKQHVSLFHVPIKYPTKKKIDPDFIRSRSSTAKRGILKHKNASLVSGTGHIKTPAATPKQYQMRSTASR